MESDPETVAGHRRAHHGLFPAVAGERVLTELDQVGRGMVGELARGMEDAEFPGGAGGFPVVGGGGITLDLTVNVDAGGATADDAEVIGQTTAERIREVVEDIVRESFYSTVMQEV